MKLKLQHSPEKGDTRINEGCLWLPKVINNDLRWLVYQKWLQRYDEMGWVDVCWIDESKPAI